MSTVSFDLVRQGPGVDRCGDVVSTAKLLRYVEITAACSCSPRDPLPSRPSCRISRIISSRGDEPVLSPRRCRDLELGLHGLTSRVLRSGSLTSSPSAIALGVDRSRAHQIVDPTISDARTACRSAGRCFLATRRACRTTDYEALTTAAQPAQPHRHRLPRPGSHRDLGTSSQDVRRRGRFGIRADSAETRLRVSQVAMPCARAEGCAISGSLEKSWSAGEAPCRRVPSGATLQLRTTCVRASSASRRERRGPSHVDWLLPRRASSRRDDARVMPTHGALNLHPPHRRLRAR